MRSRNLILVAFVIVGAVLYYLQDQWLTRDIDDYDLSTIMELAVDDSGQQRLVHVHPVTSFGDAVKSQATAYHVYNGRFLNQILEQWFCATQSGKTVAVFNTLVWALLLTCFILLSYGKDRIDLPNLVVALAVLWLLMPNALKMFLGSISGTANYLWGGAANLFFLLLFDRMKEPGKKRALATVVAAAVCSLLVGCMQESFSIGISVGLVVYALLHLKQMPRIAWFMIACYLIGTALNTMAPANFIRSEAVGQGFRSYVIIDMLKVPAITLFLLLSLVALVWRPAVLGDVLKRNTVIVVAILVNAVFALFMAYTGAWQLTCISLLCSILMLQLYSRLFSGRTFRIIVACLAACGFIAVYAMQYPYRKGMWEVEQAMYEDARASSDGLISVKRAFDIDMPYRQSRLAPVYRQYLNNTPEILIINNQQNGVSLLSKYLTRCANPDLVKAVLPDSAEAIARAFDSGQAQTLGNVKAIELYNFAITRGTAEDADPLQDELPCQQWQYGGKWYKLYNKSIGYLNDLLQ